MGINVVNRAGLGFTYANVDDLGLMGINVFNKAGQGST